MKNSHIFLPLLFALLLGAAPWAVAAGTNTDYRVGAGDVIKVTVFGHPDLTSELRVSEAGSISFPLIGEVKINGMSTSAVESQIANRLEFGGFIRQPQVNVMVLQ